MIPAAKIEEGGCTVSVIIPTHGRPQFLRRALASVARQSRLPAEVVVVDDLGDPDTDVVMVEVTPEYPVPLRLLRNQQGGGACASRNLGAAASIASNIAFLDDDDEWQQSFLNESVRALAGLDVDFVCTEIDRVFTNGTIKRLIPPDDLSPYNVLKRRAYMTGSSFLIRRSAFDAVGGFDPAVPVFNDWDLFIRLVRSGCRYTVVHRALVRWMEHEGERITTGTIRRADGLDRFLRVYGADMSPGIRMYYTRLAYGIRKAHEPSTWRRLVLTARMLKEAGLRSSITLAMRTFG